MNEELALSNKINELSPEQKKAMALLIQAKKQKMEEEPLYKHRFNNLAQARFRALDNRYRNHKAANKVGKTDVCACYPNWNTSTD